ncbi:MAG TPA: hypothetical protein VFR41_05895, partial [Acidimicrobiia bacterium]|nr:hypothetical protein [Acidimicrobiia bacterium]
YTGNVWAMMINRTVVSGVRFHAGQWQRWDKPACDGLMGEGVLAVDFFTVYAACDEGVWGTAADGGQGWALYTSKDSGATFGLRRPIKGSVTALAVSDPGVVFVGTSDGRLITMSDPPQTVTLDAGAVQDIGFPTSDVGFAITSTTDSQQVVHGALYTTRDRGLHWERVPIVVAP